MPGPEDSKEQPSETESNQQDQTRNDPMNEAEPLILGLVKVIEQAYENIDKVDRSSLLEVSDAWNIFLGIDKLYGISKSNPNIARLKLETEEKIDLLRAAYNSSRFQKNTKENIKNFQAKNDGLKMLDNPEMLKSFLADRKSISDVLGFTPESIDKFYQAAHQLIAQKRWKEAKDAFFFLVTIAPQVSECWLGLGLAYGQCKETEGAIQSYLRAIALSPHKADGYVSFVRLFTVMNDLPRAQKVCDIGLSFVKEHEKQPWAQELGRALNETKQELKKH